MRDSGPSTAATIAATRTHFRRVNRAMPPKVPMAFWLWPLGKEYPVACARALSTMVKSLSSTHGLGMRNSSFKN